MPVYTEGFLHQQGCPHDSREKARGRQGLGDDPTYEDLLETASSSSSSTEAELLRHYKETLAREADVEKLCSDKRCCTWFDLANWFGYLPLLLPAADFEACFTDVAHGGTGCAARLLTAAAAATAQAAAACASTPKCCRQRCWGGVRATGEGHWVETSFLGDCLSPTSVGLVVFGFAFPCLSRLALYEKLVVLGGKTLDIMGEMHFYEMFGTSKEVKVPSDLRADKEALRLLWARKRVERVTALNSLFLFGRSYLASAQTLPTRQAVAKFVKASIGYCCQTADSENMYTWLPVLVEHIFFTQRLTTERLAQDNAVLQDLQEYLGYKYDHLIPRIRECLEGSPVPQRSDSPTGRELLRLYATDYFTKMSEETGVEPSRRVLWVDEEVEHFLAGSAIPAFACLYMSLAPFVVELEQGGPLRAEAFSSMFESLIAACWIISTEEKVKVWMPSLIQRLRQTQLTLHMAQMGDKYFSANAKLRKPTKQPVDARRFASANNGMVDSFALWNIDPMRRPLPEGPVEAPPGPRFMPEPLHHQPMRGAPVVESSCCFPPFAGPRFVTPQQQPSNPAGTKRLTLFDGERNRYEFFPVGVKSLPPTHRRRPKQGTLSLHPAAPAAAAAAAVRREFATLLSPGGGSPPGSGSSAEIHCLANSCSPPSSFECLLLLLFSGPVSAAVPAGSWAPQHQSVMVPSPPPGDVAASVAAAAGEPRVKIRYLTDDGSSGGVPKNDVEVFIDDVPVHTQSLPPFAVPGGAGPDFRAVLSTANSRPVVLNFARRGEDGKPTVYVTEGRQQETGSSPWLLQPVSPGLPTRPSPPPAASCCCACPEVGVCCCGPRQTNDQAPNCDHAQPARAPPAVDILVSPAPPLAGSGSAAAARAYGDARRAETPPVSCVLGGLLPSCMQSRPQPAVASSVS
ncbi:hypothetical protein Esti_006406 [Eimeria stiedai]